MEALDPILLTAGDLASQLQGEQDRAQTALTQDTHYECLKWWENLSPSF